MRRRIAMTAAAFALCVASSMPVYAGTWKNVNNRWMYQRNAQKYASGEWITVDGKCYYIGADGYMVTGWQQIDGQWYYMDENGEVQYGWKEISGKWYFLAPENGAMVANTTIEGREIGADGAWIPKEAEIEPGQSNLNLTAPTLLQNMTDGQKGKGYSVIAQGKTFSQEKWSNAVRLVVNTTENRAYLSCKLDGKYRLLSGTFSPSSNFPNGQLGILTVYGDDDQVLYQSGQTRYDAKPATFAVDVSEQNTVRVEFSLALYDNYSSPVMLLKDLAVYQ